MSNRALTPDQLAFEIAKRKLAIGQQYKSLNDLQAQLLAAVGCGASIDLPQLGYSLTLRDNFADKDQHWKQVCCDRYEVVLEKL